jgi:proline iminopeptidase
MPLIDRAYNVERAGADLYVEQTGPEDAPVIYYLHGGPGYSSHSFRDLLGDDLEQYRMVYPDQRGGGRSWAAEPFGLDELADDVRAVITALELPPVTLLAHGFGALTAVTAAVQHPGLIRGVVFTNPWFSMPLLARTLQRTSAQLDGHPEDAAPADGSDGLTPEELIDQAFSWTPANRIFEHLEFPRPSSRLRLEHSDSEAMLGPADSEDFTDPWRASVLPLLGSMTQGAVVLAGQHDGTSVPAQVEAGLQELPGALFSLIEGGHYPWLDDPDMFLDLLQQALQHLTGQGGSPAGA